MFEKYLAFPGRLEPDCAEWPPPVERALSSWPSLGNEVQLLSTQVKMKGSDLSDLQIVRRENKEISCAYERKKIGE